MKKYFLIIIVLTLFGSCTYHNEDEYFKDNPDRCYTDDVSYQNDILPVLEASCISCHSSANLSGGIDLSNHSEIKQVAESGLLLGVLRHDMGFKPMPQNANKLSDCTILKIEAWIDQGLKNN